MTHTSQHYTHLCSQHERSASSMDTDHRKCIFSSFIEQCSFLSLFTVFVTLLITLPEYD